ncbi:MAG: hypothetical protein AAF639_37830 [Chloroflexota bacterium]
MFKLMQRFFSPDSKEAKLMALMEQAKKNADETGDTNLTEEQFAEMWDLLDDDMKNQLIAKFEDGSLEEGTFKDEMASPPVFEGDIKHGYSYAFVGDADVCPRCQATTEDKYAYILYSTTGNPRMMLAPAGRFCPSCPTVIIDEEWISENSQGDVTFRATLAINRDGEDDNMFFETWNGEPAMYAVDENENPHSIVSANALDQDSLEQTEGRRSSVARPKRDRKAQKAKRKQRKKNRK